MNSEKSVGFHQWSGTAAGVVNEKFPGAKFDTLSAYPLSGKEGRVTVAMSDTGNNNMNGESIYLSRDEAVAFATHILNLAAKL